jgi:iron complex outermembrane recepter protein
MLNKCLKHRKNQRYRTLLIKLLCVCLLLYVCLIQQVNVHAEVYDIPEQPLNTALRTLSKQSGLQIFSSHRLTRGHRCLAVSGDTDAESILIQLLSRSGLSYKKLRDNIIVIIKQNKPTSIDGQNTSSVDSLFLEEIVITSRRRAEYIQHAPLSVAPFTEEKLERLNIAELPELSRIVPNFTIVPSPPISGNTAASAVFIRGVGQLDFTINVDPGVGTYIDGVYMARSVGGVIDLIDLERVEVLRGPQGTLFGRNTIGGAVRLISKAPDSEFGGYVATTFGSDHRTDLQGVVNMPITDDLLSKLSVLSRQRDGYVIDGNGTDLGNDDSVSARAQFVWAATNSMDFALNVDMTRDRENGAANVPLNLYADTPIPLRTNTGTAGEGTLAGCTSAAFNTSRNCFGPAWLNGNKHRTESTFPAQSDNDINGVSLTVNYALTWADFKSISAYRELDSTFQRDSDHTPFHVFATANEQQQKQLSQEFQWLGDSQNNQLIWVTGLYYFDETASDFTRVFLPAPTGEPMVGEFHNEVSNKNWALYAEATYDIDSDLHLTLGTRLTQEKKQYASIQSFVLVESPHLGRVPLVIEPGTSVDYTEYTSRLTISFDISDQLMTYATYSEGFKSGGFNARHLAPAPELRPIAYAPEYVTQYEAGLKFNNALNNIRINAAAFFSDYKDIQISTNPDFNSNATITQNAAEAEISGMELEFTAAPNSHWSFSGGIGYLDAGYQSLQEDVAIDISNDFVWAPLWSASLAVSYFSRFENGATLIPRWELAYQSDTQGTAENEKDVRQSSYLLQNASIMFRDSNQHWTLSLGLANMTDKRFLISANQNQALGYAEGVYARGRTWHLSAKKYF